MNKDDIDDIVWSQSAICPKCESDKIKVISPSDEITYICEECGFKKKLGNTVFAKRLHDTEMFFINCMSFALTEKTREIDLEEIRQIKLRRFAEIMEEEYKDVPKP